MKIRNGIVLLILISANFSCSKSFLEIDPSGKVTGDKLFRDMSGLRAALYGTYTLMADYYAGQFTLYGDVAGDHILTSQASGSGMKHQYNYQSNPVLDTTPVLYIWESIFIAINNTNKILNSIPSLRASFPGNSVEIDGIEGQALVFRALCHFDLTRVYGQTYTYTNDASHLGVPLTTVTPSPGQSLSRDNVKNTYDFITKDLKRAEQLLKNLPVPDNYTVSRNAVWAMLSRVYLYKHDWDQSIAYADSVINKSGLSLTTGANYSRMYRTFEGTGNEVIWQLYSKGLKGAELGNEYFFHLTISTKLTSLFTSDDVRKNLIQNNNTLKYVGENITTDQWPINPKVFRLSEMYLNRAEAYWNKQSYLQAIADVKAVSDRSHTSSTIIIPSDPSLLYQFINDERSRELCFEGHRLYDITRRNQSMIRGSDCNAFVCSVNYPDNRFILPIPQAELDANKTMQPNPGIN